MGDTAIRDTHHFGKFRLMLINGVGGSPWQPVAGFAGAGGLRVALVRPLHVDVGLVGLEQKGSVTFANNFQVSPTPFAEVFRAVIGARAAD